MREMILPDYSGREIIMTKVELADLRESWREQLDFRSKTFKNSCSNRLGARVEVGVNLFF